MRHPLVESARHAWRRAWGPVALIVAMATAVLVGCGGGVGSGGTGTYASGPITGFGSIIVNGIRFDESTASVLDDDDGTRTRSELKLGMTVEVDSDAIRSDTTGRLATATRVRLGSALVGPVSAINVGAGTLTILGQTVQVAADTVFDERLAGGLAGLSTGRLLEVYALYDAAQERFAATRIEPRTSTDFWLLRAPVAALDAAARTLRIGASTFAYGSAASVPPDLAVGSVVRLRLQTATDGAGRYVVRSFGAAVRAPDDRDECEVEGGITSFTSATAFQVNGIAVNAAAASFPDGTSGLRLGARVQVQGALRGGVLVASKVEVETEQSVEDRGFELKGTITAVDTVAKTFVLREQTISYALGSLVIEGGTLANLVIGAKVEVKARPSADRTRMEATKIEFGD